MQNAFVWVGAFITLAVVVTYWKWLLGAAVLGAVVWGVYVAAVALRARRQDRLNGARARLSALAARAQVQHEQYLAGDERGLYGAYRPAPLD
ncbi:MAG: hypothetical protein WAX14_16300 [Rhodococcus sp. (in: high G+C Gram-positive bacteria)]|uniref:hypothetical protein n=1 Tax=Rhodococcus sp. TaxID=1831 RepID=UPI003BB70951